MILNRKQFDKWIKALRSGKYKQTTGTLQNKEGYCCLGVACELFIPKNKRQFESDWIEDEDGDEKEVISTFLNGDLPEEQKYAPKWLKDINTDFENRSNLGDLTLLNDNKRWSFKEIADALVEAFPEKKKAKMKTKAKKTAKKKK
jgi:hypothetical protein